MPRPSLRSRSRKRLSLPSPGGSIKKHYKREKANFARCSRCGGILSGVSRLFPSRLSASQRRPERIYGGQLCPNCLRNLLKFTARG
ncbi:MAG: 50S ribosomal protein L34e [Candidatus Bathyarchaeia archaeon]